MDEIEKIKINSVWFYNGGKIGRGIPHTVIQVEEDEIVSWSNYELEKPAEGYSWVGTPQEFLSSFKFVRFQDTKK